MSKATKRALEILRAIYDAIQETGYPPSVREIAEAVGLRGWHGVAEHLMRLERHGLLFVHRGTPRGLKITPEGFEALGVAPDGGDPRYVVIKVYDIRGLRQ
jgi:repressor LexA